MNIDPKDFAQRKLLMDEEQWAIRYKQEFIDEKMLEKYATVSKIGKGAYGIVWKGIDRQSKK